MIHAYNECFLDLCQEKLGSLFEVAVYEEKLSLDEISEKFLSSPVCHAFEVVDPIYIAGKSAIELLGSVLNKEMEQTE